MANDASPDPLVLPEDFAYLRPTISRVLKLPLTLPLIERARSQFTPDEFEQVARAYHEIARRGDARRLSAWVEAAGRDVRSFEASDAGKVFGLLALFTRLAHEGEPPFTSREVEFDPPEPRLDWGKLPEALRYLAAPAQRFGGRRFGDRPQDLVAAASEADRRELRVLRDRIVRAGHVELLFDWVERGTGAVDEPNHEEAERVNNLLDLMGAVGIAIE